MISTADSASFQKPVKDMNNASGCPPFAPLKATNETRLLKDNCLFIKMNEFLF